MIITPPSWKNLLLYKQNVTLKLTPEDTDDIYTLYSVLDLGDEVECTTFRKVLIENSSSTTSGETTKKKLTLAVCAEKIDIDLVSSGSLRINGKNVLQNEWVKLGAYHTLDIEVGRVIKITKLNGWDVYHRHLLVEASDPANKNEVGAVLLMPDGISILGMIVNSEQGFRTIKRIEVTQPKKKIGSAVEKAEERFYVETEKAIHELFDLTKLKVLVIASLGDLKEKFSKWLLEKAVRENNRTIIENKNKFLKLAVHDPKHLEVLLESPNVQEVLNNTKTAQERKLLGQFQKILHDPNSTGYAIYGPNHIQKAIEYGAIKNLLISNVLFKSSNVQDRKKYGKLIEEVLSNGGQVRVFTAETDTEQELNKLTGIAAILKFPVDEY